MAPRVSDDESGSEQGPIDTPVAEAVDNVDEAADNNELIDDDEDEGLFGSDDDEEDGVTAAVGSDAMDVDAEELPQKILEASLPKHEKSHAPAKDTLLFRLPAFLSIDAKPFDPKVFLEKTTEVHDDQDEQGDALKERRKHEKLIAENTIRWRYAKNDNDVLYKQSNSQVIEWEDGSLSLKLGNEIFDIKDRAVDDSVLTVADFDQTVLRTDAILNKQVKVVPVSTLSQTHRKLTKAITAMQKIQRSNKMNAIVTEDDPLKLQREEEKREQQKMKEIRRKQRQELEANEAVSSSSASKSSYYSRYAGIDVADDEEDGNDDEPTVRRSRLGDGYDDDDGFIIQDDEEEESGEGEEEDEDELDRAAERLRKVKEAGSKKYEDNDEEDEEDEDVSSTKEEDEVEGEDEEKTAKRKKRRVIVDDDDDDE
ncbi:unnamed protein product [Kuraishia capsulata CBS 1993]|uniref:Leo1-like protein n=1 Tax=Kuraishia capsulata CBS 1993 TaxID=1382522 RepID=W6MSX5_9ASCO|nr:uncharacterized protein KUCA_T00005456001 [Kuraishia capsulata CBS 1993]CDK29468.1 unnamed protein product [Kuraishia capsulata CBS 1993]